MLKLVYEILINPLGLNIEPIWEYAILLIIGEIAHELAYWISPGGKVFGSFIYWISKLMVFLIVWAILYAIIVMIKFVITNWILFTIIVLIFLVISVTIIIKMKKNIKKVGKNNEN